MIYINVAPPSIYGYKEVCGVNMSFIKKHVQSLQIFIFFQPEDHVYSSSCSYVLPVNKNYFNWFPWSKSRQSMILIITVWLIYLLLVIVIMQKQMAYIFGIPNVPFLRNSTLKVTVDMPVSCLKQRISS